MPGVSAVHLHRGTTTRLARDEAMTSGRSIMLLTSKLSRGRCAALLLTTLLAVACDDGDDGDTAADSGETDASSSDGGTETDGEALAIIGNWVDDFAGMHAITETQWVQTFGADTFTYSIDHFDNDTHVVVAQSDDDMTWARFDWSFAEGGTLYYCQSGFGLASPAEADATAPADASDPVAGGCGMFPWSVLTPA
jgi:hypothetical protein